jgi:sulfonate transport system substrate-binding protein
MRWRDLLTYAWRARPLSTGLTAKRLQRIAQGFNPGWGSHQNCPEGATDVKPRLAPRFRICADKPLNMTPRRGHPPILQRYQNRSPFRGEAWDGTYPGLKPWAMVYNRFAVRAEALCAIISSRWAALSCSVFLTLVLPTHAEDQKLSSVRIGYQKYGTLNVLKAEGSLEKSLSTKGITVTWTLFPAGPQLLEALNAGSIDLGNTGEAPPVFAQAAGVNLVYFGNQPPFPKGEGILVRKDSPVQHVPELKGKRIALNKGSNVHFFLVKLLEKNGLKIDDITPVYLSPADAWAALEGGSVDAWAIWDPYMSAAIDRSGARVLQDAVGVAANREFFLADRRFAEAHQEILLAVRDAVGRCGIWVTTKPEEVVHYLAPQLGMSEQVISKVVRAQPWGFQPITDQVVSDQQTIGDTFYSLKLIPKTIQAADAVVRIPD